MLGPAPSIVTVELTGGTATLKIIVDTKSFAHATVLNLLLRGQLVNYPDATPLDLDFQVIIEEANTFVFVPPAVVEETEKEEEEPPEPEAEESTPRTDPDLDLDLSIIDEGFKEKVLTKSDHDANKIRENINQNQKSNPFPYPFVKLTNPEGYLSIGFT